MDGEQGKVELTAEQIEELAWHDYMDAREAALNAAVGCLIVNTVSSDSLRVIAKQTTAEVLRFAAQIALHARGEEWSIEQRREEF